MSRMICRFSYVLFLLLGNIFPAAGQTAPERPKPLRVLSYNIHIGIGMDKKLDLERTAEAIKDLRPDIVALQEVDRFADRTRKVDQPAELSRLTGMNVVFGKTIDRSNGEYGIAILSKYPILEHKITRLPRLEGEEDRGALEAKIRIDGDAVLRFVCVHFCHRNEERRTRQAAKINELFADDGLPTIVAGDFNARPESKAIATLLEKWGDATDRTPTFGNPPKSKIDYIFYRPVTNFRLQETRVVDDRMTSDHYPVLSVLEFVPD